MTIRDLLTTFYNVQPAESITIDQRDGIIANGVYYFTTKVANVETIHMEQIVLAYYLLENGYQHIALPLQNQQEEWFTNYYDDRYMVYQVQDRKTDRESTGESLARFHQIGSSYPYEPKAISSYGQWKRLWIEKVTLFEEEMQTRSKTERTSESQILFDAFPYLIGMTENAIQYLRETEGEEMRHSNSDQGSISFMRFDDTLQSDVIWPDQLYYDHPARDIAEHIRKLLLADRSDRIILDFIQDYQRIRSLSVFSWRLVYARLLFPSHLYDSLQRCFYEGQTESYRQFKKFLQQQGNYEKRLKNFYHKAGVDKEALQLTELDWI